MLKCLFTIDDLVDKVWPPLLPIAIGMEREEESDDKCLTPTKASEMRPSKKKSPGKSGDLLSRVMFYYSP